MVAALVQLHPPHTITPGKTSFESMTSVAFGPFAHVMSMGLDMAICFLIVLAFHLIEGHVGTHSRLDALGSKG
jgi:hypothetical protein